MGIIYSFQQHASPGSCISLMARNTFRYKGFGRGLQSHSESQVLYHDTHSHIETYRCDVVIVFAFLDWVT